MKSEIFNKELDYINNDDIKEFAKTAIENLPDYFFEVAASSTGKYHPQYALGQAGLVRHTKAATRFANHIFQLEHIQNEFSERERDLMIVAILLHDGWKHGNNGSSFTTHEHPQVCADWIKECEALQPLLSQKDKKFIASCVASHMGQWNENKRSKMVLEKPITRFQQIVHICDYLASRKDIEVLFEDSETPKIDINTYKLSFGKHNGELLVDVAKSNRGYVEWMKGNMKLQEPLKSLVSEVLN